MNWFWENKITKSCREKRETLLRIEFAKEKDEQIKVFIFELDNREDSLGF